jgi:radical SAM protein with 4Fe4S-binding SPASM domain
MIFNKKHVFFDKNLYIKKHGDKYVVYSDKLQKILVVNHNFAQQLITFCEQVKFGEKIKYEVNNEFISILENKGIIYFDKKDYNSRVKYVENKLKFTVKKLDLQYFYLHLTQKCNLNCEYCYNKDNLNKREDLSLEKWKLIIDKLSLNSKSVAILTGGEVFIRKDLDKIIEYLKNTGCRVEILTNGTLLNRNIKILETIDQMIVSLDTINQNYNIRKNTIKYNIIENLKSVPERYKNKIVIRSVLTKYNENDILKTKDFVENILGMKHITNDLVPCTFDDFKNMSEKYIEYSDCNAKSISYSACTACTKTIALDSNGDIYPCQTLIKNEFKIGNILKDDIYKQILKTKIYRNFKKFTLDNVKNCNKCNIKYICGGGCRAIAYNLYKNINHCNEAMCDKYRNVIDENLKKIVGLGK